MEQTQSSIKTKLMLALLICAVVALVVVVYIAKNGEADPTGTITVIVKDLEGNVVTEDAIDFYEEATAFDILVRYYEGSIQYQDSIYGPFLLAIAGVETDGYTSWLSIYVDGEYSTVGIGDVLPRDGMTIVLAHENTW